MASPLDYLDNARVPQANVLQQVAQSPAPVQAPASSIPRMSAVNAWNDIGKALMMMSGPTSRQMVYDQENHGLDMQKSQMAVQESQAKLDAVATQKVMTAVPALEDAFNQGGAPAAQAAWEQLVPVLGIAPEKAAQLHQMLQTDPQGTIRQMKAMIPKKDQGSLPGSIQEFNLTKSFTPEQVAALPPLARARLEAMANPNAIKPAQQAQIGLREQEFRYRRGKDARDFGLKLREFDRKGAAGPAADGGAPPPKIPATMTTAYVDTQSAISQIDRAIAGVKKNPAAFGISNMLLPDFAKQRTDPKGVGVRGIVSDIGSMVIHDRTGATMAAKEAQRLIPFIPRDSDTPDKILSNLLEMKRRLQGDQFYRKEMFPTLEKSPTAAPRQGGSGNRAMPAGATKTATGPNGAKKALVGGKWVDY